MLKTGRDLFGKKKYSSIFVGKRDLLVILKSVCFNVARIARLKLVTEDNGIKCLKWSIPKTFFWLVTND